mmetsp:Transcript_76029/g.180936  ORF Transcript_76029/g.180936 Transcript_76029/m.180936 type:complete len:665 (+) Transcript_76029:97-2091(+)
MASFRAFEPSEAMLAAMKARASSGAERALQAGAESLASPAMPPSAGAPQDSRFAGHHGALMSALGGTTFATGSGASSYVVAASSSSTSPAPGASARPPVLTSSFSVGPGPAAESKKIPERGRAVGGSTPSSEAASGNPRAEAQSKSRGRAAVPSHDAAESRPRSQASREGRARPQSLGRPVASPAAGRPAGIAAAVPADDMFQDLPAHESGGSQQQQQQQQPQLEAADAAPSEFLRAAEDFVRGRAPVVSEDTNHMGGEAPGADFHRQGSSRGSVTSVTMRGMEAGLGDLPPIPFSAATLGGVPVAMDGDLVYLGGGVYASMASAFGQGSREESSKQRPPRRGRVLPGRVRPTEPRAQRVRSVGTPGSNASTPVPERAQSDGDLASAASARQAPPAPSGPPIWKPSGPAKLPPLPPASQEAVGSSRGPIHYSEAPVPGRNCDERAAARDALRHEGMSLFGPAGVLQELVAPPEDYLRHSRKAPAGSVPSNGARREAERKQLKEAKIQLLLEEKAEREAEESLNKERKKEALRHASSAPELRGLGRHGLHTIVPPAISEEEEIEQRRLRLAYKMEVIDFFKGYSGKVNKMTAEQSKVLLRNLNSSASTSAKRGESRDEAPGRDPNEAERHSVHARLQEANELCNRIVAGDDEAADGRFADVTACT